MVDASSFTSVWDTFLILFWPHLIDIPVTDINGTKYAKLGDKFPEGKPKVSIFVNVASQCGLTDNHYSQLTELSNKQQGYKSHGLEILAFPCNQFGSQEPGTNDEILDFVCSRYSSSAFHLFDKIDVNKQRQDLCSSQRQICVNGADTHTIYNYLKTKADVEKITWNFGKFLVNQDGQVIEYVAPQTTPNETLPKFEHLLTAP